MSEIFERIGCRECTSPDCRGCNVYDLEQALKTGKLDWMMGENKRIRIPNKPPVHLDKDDCKNVAEFLEWEFFAHLKNLLDVDDLDNIGYLRSLIRAMDELFRAAGEERAT